MSNSNSTVIFPPRTKHFPKVQFPHTDFSELSLKGIHADNSLSQLIYVKYSHCIPLQLRSPLLSNAYRQKPPKKSVQRMKEAVKIVILTSLYALKCYRILPICETITAICRTLPHKLQGLIKSS